MEEAQNSTLINTYRIVKSTKAEGPGIRLCIWFQGCSRHCDGCFAVDTWSHETNRLVSVDKIKAMLEADSQIEGITVLGGEPFEQPRQLLHLLQAAKSLNKTAVVFTGNTLEELCLKDKRYMTEIADYIDVLIDGAYEKSNRSFERPLVGSSNQRFHFFTDKYSIEDFPKNKLEIRIDKNGSIRINGMSDFEKLYRSSDL
jgi:anaerobic ribonucleoside-triphosphate reductase activating protein